MGMEGPVASVDRQSMVPSVVPRGAENGAADAASTVSRIAPSCTDDLVGETLSESDRRAIILEENVPSGEALH
jgi:hypothetical protein